MRKRIVMILILFVIVGIVYPIRTNEVHAAEVQEADENDFVIEDGVLTGYTGAGGDVVIPDGVTSIGDYAFQYCSSLTSIELPDSVTSIGDSAFYICESLTDIELPSSITSVGDSAFYGCRGLNKIVIPDSVTSVGDSAFSGCSSLISVKMPSSITCIGNNTFSNCSGLSEIELPSGITSIGNAAFGGCSGLTNLELPVSVTNVGSSAFGECSNLTVQMSYGGSGLSMGDNAFSGCKSLRVKVLDGVTCIEDSAFRNCNSLTEIEIPNSVMSIDDCAFWGCSSLTEIKIPDSVTDIGIYAFSDCNSLTEIKIPDSVTNIGQCAFSNCSSLKNIEIPDGITYIHSFFSGCNSLENVKIPDSVTDIGIYAFSGCSSLKKIELPNGVTSIGDSAFLGCSSLTEIEIPNSVIMGIGSSAFSGCSSLTEIIIPDGVTGIGESAFSGCEKLTNIVMPVSTSGWSAFYIGEKTFSGCSSLTGIQLPKGTGVIGNAAFYGCNNFTDIEIPAGTTSIGTNAFRNCSSLKKIGIPESVTSIGGYAFDGCNEELCIYGNEGTYAQTYATENLINYMARKNQTITASDFTKTVGDEPFSLNVVTDGDGILTYESSDEEVVSVSDSGIVTIYEEGKATITITACGTAEWKEEQKSIDILVYSNSEDEFCIGSEFGYYDEGDWLVKREGILYAYRGDAEEVTIPDNVYVIEEGAFSGCDTVTSINIHKDVGIISAAAFDNCRNLKAINVEEVDEDYEADYRSIDGVLYSNGRCIRCPEGKEGSVEIPHTTKQISTGAFSGCSKLTGVTILGKNTRIYDNAFVGCSEDFYIDCLKGSYAETYAIQNGINYVSRKQQQQDFVYESDITVVIGDEPYTLDVDSEEVAGELTYASSNETIVKVSADGVLTFVGVGTAQITITASETDEFYERQEVINITVNNSQNEGQTSGGDQNPNEGQTPGGDQNPNEGQTSGGDQNPNEGQTSGGDQNPNEEPDSTQELEKEEQTISAKNFKKTYGTKPFSLGAKTDGGGELTYSVENKKIAKVDKNGKVTIKGCGVTKIVINAAENEDYDAATKTITLTVVPKKARLTSVKSTKTKTITVKWKKDANASGYIIEYSTDKKFKKNVGKVTVSKNKTTSKKISKLKAGKKYYVRVCAYTVSKGNKIKGAYTKAKMVKVKK